MSTNNDFMKFQTMKKSGGGGCILAVISAIGIITLLILLAV